MRVIDYNGIKTTKSKIPEYSVWRQIKDRCTNKNNKCYPRYGGRGITFCDRWLSFDNFIEDMGYRPIGGEKMTIERVNVHGNYEPSNCVWATWTEQHRNTTRSRFIEYDGNRKSLPEWAEYLGVTRHCLFDRIKRLGDQKAIEISIYKKLQTN